MAGVFGSEPGGNGIARNRSARSVYWLNCSISFFLIASASVDAACLEGGLGELPLFFDVLVAVVDRVFELTCSMQGEQVPFSLVGIVGGDLFGEFSPLADGGQVILSLRGPGRQFVGDDELSFRIVSRFGED